MAVIPTGTANDFARGMGIPLEVPAACRLAAAGARLRTLDLGRLDGRPFLNVASLGLAAVAAREAQGLKRALGPLSYVVGALRAGLGAAPVRCRVACDGRELFAGPAWQVIVANSGRFGAGAAVKAADPEDGQLDATAIPAGRRIRLFGYGYAMRTGRIAGARDVRHARGRSVEVEAPPDTAWNVDGEVVSAGSATFSAEPAAVRVVVG